MLRYSIFFFNLVFTGKIYFQASQIPELTLILWNIMLPTVWEDRVRKNLSHLDILKFMGLLGMRMMVLREPCSITLRLVCIIFKNSWQ